MPIWYQHSSPYIIMLSNYSAVFLCNLPTLIFYSMKYPFFCQSRVHFSYEPRILGQRCPVKAVCHVCWQIWICLNLLPPSSGNTRTTHISDSPLIICLKDTNDWKLEKKTSCSWKVSNDVMWSSFLLKNSLCQSQWLLLFNECKGRNGCYHGWIPRPF